MKDINELLERIKAESNFAKKYLALSGIAEIVSQAEEDGYTVTKDDVEGAMQKMSQHNGELSEAELVVVTGGKTNDNYSDSVCSGISRVTKRCTAAYYDESPAWCVYLTRASTGRPGEYGWCKKHSREMVKYTCSKGRFDYAACQKCEETW